MTARRMDYSKLLQLRPSRHPSPRDVARVKLACPKRRLKRPLYRTFYQTSRAFDKHWLAQLFQLRNRLKRMYRRQPLCLREALSLLLAAKKAVFQKMKKRLSKLQFSFKSVYLFQTRVCQERETFSTARPVGRPQRRVLELLSLFGKRYKFRLRQRLLKKMSTRLYKTPRRHRASHQTFSFQQQLAESRRLFSPRHWTMLPHQSFKKLAQVTQQRRLHLFPKLQFEKLLTFLKKHMQK